MCRHAHTLYVGICVSQFMYRSQRTTRKDLFCLPLPCGSCKFNWVIRLAASSFTQWAITPASSEVVSRFVSRCSCSREVCSYDLIILPPYGSSVFEDLCCRNSCGVSGTWCVCGSRAEALLRPLQVVSLVKPLNMSSKRPERTGLVYPGQARPGQARWWWEGTECCMVYFEKTHPYGHPGDMWLVPSVRQWDQLRVWKRCSSLPTEQLLLTAYPADGEPCCCRSRGTLTLRGVRWGSNYK